MQRLGLDAAALGRYHDALAAPTRVERTRVLVMDSDRNVERDVVLLTLDGQVSVNVDVEQAGETTRALALNVADPTGSLGLDETSVGAYPMFPQKLIQVRHGLRVPADGWRDVAVHTGPLTKATPADTGAVEVAAQGMEALWAGAQKPRSWKAGTPKTDIIKALARGTGERDAFMAIPDLPKRVTPKRFVLLDTDNPWRRARQLARSMGYELFYDGRGVLIMRRRPTTGATFTFGEAMVLGDLLPAVEDKPIFNTFEVVGAKPKGSKKRVTSGRPPVELDDDHPWSAKSLGRNGQPRVLLQRESNDQYTRKIDCRFRAFQLREEAIRQTTEVPAEVVSAPHLDELDRARVVAGNGQRVLTLRQLTIPLAGQSQALATVVNTGDAFVPPRPKPPKKKRPAKKAAAGNRRRRNR